MLLVFSLKIVVLAVTVTSAVPAVQAVSQSLMFAVTALASVTVLLRSVQVALPTNVSLGDAMMRMVSPGAMCAAVAPLVQVFHASALLAPPNGATVPDAPPTPLPADVSS